jgi:hypothetical protein
MDALPFATGFAIGLAGFLAAAFFFIFYSLREATLYLSILLISKTNLIT